jgi:uncharacterized phage protein (TIGR01671 family)
MREIKFRAWDTNSSDWAVASVVLDTTISDPRRQAIDKGLILRARDGVVIEQYTGLKDKNGKEIYEGDILDSITGRPLVVAWVDSPAGFDLLFNKDAPISLYANYAAKSEIIGNIHENPELLK